MAPQFSGPNVELQRLLLRSGLHSTAASRQLWFGDSRLVGNVLIAPDHDTGAMIERCFLPMLRKVMSDLTLRVEQLSEPKKSAPMGSVFKKAYTGKLEKAEKQRDLL